MKAPEETKHPSQAKWREKNPLKRWAHIATASALRRGLIRQRPCEVCGAEPAEAHHENYLAPLEVQWLCRAHHKEHHAELKKQEAADG